MGILEVTDAAWDSADYTYTWEGITRSIFFFFFEVTCFTIVLELRKDFEIEYRYRDIRTKLELIKDDSRFKNFLCLFSFFPNSYVILNQ